MRRFCFTFIPVCFLLFWTGIGISNDLLPGPYPAEVIEVVDGDTIKASVRIWPGLIQETLVRIDGLDTPEIHGKCDYEKALAQKAKAKTTELVSGSENQVLLYAVHDDKYGGRVVAKVETVEHEDMTLALIGSGLGREYHGEKKSPWCALSLQEKSF